MRVLRTEVNVPFPDTARKTCREDGWFTHNGTLEEWTDFSGCDKTDDIVQMEYIRSALQLCRNTGRVYGEDLLFF